MTVEEMTRRVDALLVSAKEAGECYDFLYFEAEAIPPSDFTQVIGACLSHLEEDLAQFAMDLRTLPIQAAA